MPCLDDIVNRRKAGLARMGKSAAALARAEQDNRDTGVYLDAMRAEAVRAIVDTWPALTTEQREQLRPILAGTIPADTARAAETAA